MWETWVRSLGREDSLEKEMAISSSILAWKVQYTEEPGGLQSIGSQRVRHHWRDSMHAPPLTMCSVATVCPTLWDPMDGSPPGSFVPRITPQEYWSRWPFPPSGALPHSVIKPEFPTAPALAGGILYDWATWEAPYFTILRTLISLALTQMPKNNLGPAGCYSDSH